MTTDAAKESTPPTLVIKVTEEEEAEDCHEVSLEAFGIPEDVNKQ
jgi:hypothetical protein